MHFFFLINNNNSSKQKQNRHEHLFHIPHLAVLVLPQPSQRTGEETGMMHSITIISTLALILMMIYIIYLDRTGRL